MTTPDPGWLYQHSSILIATVLFFSIILFNELGFYLGRYVQRRTSDEVKSLTGSIQASILGLLALLLGFTFSMSMERFNARSMAVIDEANVIQQSMLHASRLPERESLAAQQLLSQYVDAKIELSSVSIANEQERIRVVAHAIEIQKALLQVSLQSEFTNSVFKLIEHQNTRNALIKMHVPDVVLILLFIVFVASVAILGYSVGLSGSRMTVQITMVSLLITLIVFIIIDLDRPKRGLIKIDQSPILYLQQHPY